MKASSNKNMKKDIIESSNLCSEKVNNIYCENEAKWFIYSNNDEQDYGQYCNEHIFAAQLRFPKTSVEKIENY